MYDRWGIRIVVRFVFIWMGFSCVLFNTYSYVVPIRLDTFVNSSSKSGLSLVFWYLSFFYHRFYIFWFSLLSRTALCHLINSNLLSVGCFVKLVDHIYFYMHYGILQYGGVHVFISWNGVVSRTSYQQAWRRHQPHPCRRLHRCAKRSHSEKLNL